MLRTGQRRKFVRIAGGTGGAGGSFPSFYLPLNDLGAGAVNTVPAIAAGSAVVTFTRASAAWAKLGTGLWASVATGIARAHYLGRDTAVGQYGGYWSEPSGVQLTTPTAAIRDMTNAAWIKVGAPTVTLTGTGIDGVPNSCTRIVANAPNTTVLMTLVAAASARTYSPFIRRVVGSGTILIQQGVTTKDVTADLNSVTLTRCELNASLLNVAYGVLIGSTGDSIDVDFNQFEAISATQQSATSPMASAGAARAGDTFSIVAAGNIDLTQGTCYAELSTNYAAAGNMSCAVCLGVNGKILFLPTIAAATSLSEFDGTNTATKAGLSSMNHVVRKRISSWGAAGQAITGDGAAPVTTAFDGAMGVGPNLEIGHVGGGFNQWGGTLKEIKISLTQATAAQESAMTA